jgi:hypothetical protein
VISIANRPFITEETFEAALLAATPMIVFALAIIVLVLYIKSKF